MRRNRERERAEDGGGGKRPGRGGVGLYFGVGKDLKA